MALVIQTEYEDSLQILVLKSFGSMYAPCDFKKLFIFF